MSVRPDRTTTRTVRGVRRTQAHTIPGCTTLPAPPKRTFRPLSMQVPPDMPTSPAYGPAPPPNRGQGRMNPAAAGGRRLAPRAPPAPRRPFAALAVFVLTAMLGGAADAAQRWYVVEIIVFDTPGNEGLDVEHWPADPGALSIEDAAGLAPGGGARAFRRLDRAGLSLNRVRNTLRRSARYRPLLHTGWRAPGLPRNAARPAYIGARLADTGNGDDPPAVYGTVKVSVGRYLHVELDLLYRLSGADVAAAPEGTPTWFRLRAERRMRSRELHYIDHPLFGALVRIAPL